MVVLLAILLLGDIISLVFVREGDPVGSIFSIASTCAFLFYLRWPPVATALLGAVFALAFVAGHAPSALFAGAIAAGLVLRLGSTRHFLSYSGGFLVATAVVAYTESIAINVGIYLIVVAIAGAIGYASRAASERRRRLEEELAESAEQEREAVLAERRWIAGELHDSIAHHLTLVALHVQMLDDPTVQAQSQEAIRVAARKAMADLRFVIDLADDGPRSSAPSLGSLADAWEEATAEIRSAGHDVSAEGDPSDTRIPRIADIVFARIVRESATNILKYAGRGAVRLQLSVEDDFASLTMLSPLPAAARQKLSSSGTGLSRMAERVIGAKGEFEAAATNDEHWRVHARLPMS